MSKKVKVTLTISKETLDFLNNYCDENFENKSLLFEKLVKKMKDNENRKKGIIPEMTKVLYGEDENE